jgi:diacylglycerol O-acyltransferase / wax synthase
VDRLTAQDLMLLWPEEFGWSQDIGALAILDGRRLLDADGRFRIETAREEIGRRLHRVPRFRQLLYRPRFGLGWPLWVDAASIDLAEHVRELPLPALADESQLLAACEELRHRCLRRSRPLWEMWFLPGLPDRRVGLFMKVHHTIADGVAGVAALGAFLDPVPDPPRSDAPPWSPAAMPTTGALFADNLRRRRLELGRTVGKLAHPVATARLARRGWPAVREAFVEARAPRTSLSRRVGWHRRFALIRSDLDLVKRVAHAYDARVNDVLMAALAGGLRELLLGRGERVEGLVLRAAVPVSLHQESGQAQGNRDGMMMVPLLIGELDKVRRLRLIAAETSRRKRKYRPQGGTLFRSVAAQRAFLRLAPYQRLVNTYAANVPGPPAPLYFAGARLLEVFPVVPIWGNVSLGVGALSYAGQFNITAVADREACPDLEVFVQGVRGSLERLAASLLVGSSAGAGPQASGRAPRGR